MAKAKAPERVLKKFRLKKGVGKHFEPNQDFDKDLPEGPDNVREHAYVGGRVVKSYRDLDKIFVNKFIPQDKMKEYDEELELTDDEQKRDAVNEEAVKATKKTRGKDDEAKELQKAGKVAVVEKGHGHEDEVLEDDDEEDDDDEGVDVDEDDDELEDETEEEPEEEESEDVTESFTKASEGDLVVRKQGKNYFVHEKGEDKPMTGSKKGFTKKSEVNAFLSKQVK